MKAFILALLVAAFSGNLLAEELVDTPAAMDPAMAQLQNLQQMRMRLEQDMATYLGNSRANTGARPMQPADAPDIRQMRQEVAGNLERLEDRFRCLDVDIKGNNGNVVLVCGDNYGPVSTNNQQAFGADLNVSGGAR